MDDNFISFISLSVLVKLKLPYCSSWQLGIQLWILWENIGFISNPGQKQYCSIQFKSKI